MDSSNRLSTSPGPDSFPAGIRVLVVDGDSACLKNLDNMLKKCNYQVTTCNLMKEALNLLEERKDGFDIVISDVNISDDMDGIKLLDHASLKMDLPVIMMSAEGETSRVMKAVQNGACDYLIKPIRTKELRNIWQHVYRRRMHEVRDIECQQSTDEIQTMKNGTDDQSDDVLSGKKRKDLDNKNHERDHSSTTKKARVVWTVDLHQKFVKAVNHIGIDKVGPKRILDFMEVPWLTRENVASHLQKYRLYLSRLQKENELKTASSGTESKNRGDKIDPPQSSNISEIGFNHSFRSLDSKVKSKPEIQQAWNAQVPSFQLKQQVLNPHFHHGFDHHLQLPMPRVPVDYVPHNPMYDNIHSSLKNLIVGTESTCGLWDEDLNGYSSSSQGSFYDTPNPNFVIDTESFGHVSPQFSDSVNEYPSGYLVTDQGLLHIA